MTYRQQIEVEFGQNVIITDIAKIGDTGLLVFKINYVDYYARLTAKGKIRKNSIKKDNF